MKCFNQNKKCQAEDCSMIASYGFEKKTHCTKYRLEGMIHIQRALPIIDPRPPKKRKLIHEKTINI